MPDHKPFTLPPGEGAKVCVGGGAGFIGSHIAKRLKESGYHVTVVGACFPPRSVSFVVSFIARSSSSPAGALMGRLPGTFTYHY